MHPQSGIFQCYCAELGCIEVEQTGSGPFYSMLQEHCKSVMTFSSLFEKKQVLKLSCLLWASRSSDPREYRQSSGTEPVLSILRITFFRVQLIFLWVSIFGLPEYEVKMVQRCEQTSWKTPPHYSDSCGFYYQQRFGNLIHSKSQGFGFFFVCTSNEKPV